MLLADNSKRLAIAGRLRSARERAGLTQEQAAAVLGLHRPAVSEVEAGRRAVAAEELAALADTYGVGVERLTGAAAPDVAHDRLERAARELGKLRPEDLERAGWRFGGGSHHLRRLLTSSLRPTARKRGSRPARICMCR